MTLTHFGLREWGSSGILAWMVTGISGFAAWRLNWCWAWGVAAFALILWLAIAFFFRNPRRSIPQDETLIMSPADGVVRDIGELEDFQQEPFTGKARRIGIFLSVLNVHLNRAPAKWNVVSKVYREGYYLDARNPECAKVNEAMTLGGTAHAAGRDFPMAVRQISGAIARRIVCPVEPGNSFEKGAIYGMIKFGSRTELYLPCDDTIEICVKAGDVVRAGETVLARIVTKAE